MGFHARCAIALTDSSGVVSTCCWSSGTRAPSSRSVSVAPFLQGPTQQEGAVRCDFVSLGLGPTCNHEQQH